LKGRSKEARPSALYPGMEEGGKEHIINIWRKRTIGGRSNFGRGRTARPREVSDPPDQHQAKEGTTSTHHRQHGELQRKSIRAQNLVREISRPAEIRQTYQPKNSGNPTETFGWQGKEGKGGTYKEKRESQLGTEAFPRRVDRIVFGEKHLLWGGQPDPSFTV